MTQKDIIEMADKCGLLVTQQLETFAKLVAEREREACAEEAECIEAWYDDNRGIAKAIRARGEA